MGSGTNEANTMIEALARSVISEGDAKTDMVATAESCTGGLIGAALTDVAGSSSVFDRGFITYSNQAKQDMLRVDGDMLKQYGAVSANVAEAMAKGALAQSRAACAVSVTGIAGPGGGTDEKPVGLVFVATASAKGTIVKKCLFESSHQTDTREAVRIATVETALTMLRDALSEL